MGPLLPPFHPHKKTAYSCGWAELRFGFGFGLGLEKPFHAVPFFPILSADVSLIFRVNENTSQFFAFWVVNENSS
eukprot:5315325-Ditylum_brightwellii.AAC.1